MCDLPIQVNTEREQKLNYSPVSNAEGFRSGLHMLVASRLFSCEKAARFQKTITDNTASRHQPSPFKSLTRRQQRPREFSKMTIAGFFSGLFGSGNGSEPQVGLIPA